MNDKIEEIINERDEVLKKLEDNKTTTISINRKLQEDMKNYMTERGIKSYSWLIQKMFEQYTRKR